METRPIPVLSDADARTNECLAEAYERIVDFRAKNQDGLQHSLDKASRTDVLAMQTVHSILVRRCHFFKRQKIGSAPSEHPAEKNNRACTSLRSHNCDTTIGAIDGDPNLEEQCEEYQSTQLQITGDFFVLPVKLSNESTGRAGVGALGWRLLRYTQAYASRSHKHSRSRWLPLSRRLVYPR